VLCVWAYIAQIREANIRELLTNPPNEQSWC
jgi:hypothetical protein